ncbi:alpha,alpha-trehalase [Enterobacter hormaechei subsp. steigerwaltii]|uniref:alpha,alpha-trehalase n=1 Tax=Enterobacter hormaechei TaxID=158836 RepID=UPI000799D7A0|nr:alpha,alpha-trehalase [Enterobacter hormaechei]MCC9337046.1 alpha,alpha-trehalase [Enterobacter hormaechei subsp. steigerwaltii]MCC9377003.1 alpha,alpha-trehalase [Enterobacter hormaechei subsp. steigerwaltii]MCC9391864.1 alpha,alpha-trehalase [Enterobacter hormaechei subsp. steigerwaltii]MCC9416899.1 alpha,alpha-trehalase [Enterobacter hormaechei subsp. steigerwaltii]MCD0213135.1 alpha,alpha-trehalase [Enterobacter hormaechei subsp. steigerwaltii]
MIKTRMLRPGLLHLTLAGALLGVTAFGYAEDQPTSQQSSPDILLGPLFNEVQSAKLFPDQKTFADAVPKSDPLTILADYRMQHTQSGFDLRHFVEMNFILPKEGEKYVPPEGQSLREHIDDLWPVLTRTTDKANKWDSLLPLPKPYVVPGGRFREVYYWDSYFTMLGLAESGHWDKIGDMVDNFAYELDTWGHIPNGNRSYYLSRSQPPFFSLMVELLATHDSDALKKYRPQMEKEYAYWMEGADGLQPGHANKRVVKLDDGSILNRYWDDRDTPRPESWLDDVTTAKNNPNRPATEIYRDLRSAAASGWDFSSRWMDDPQKLGTIRTTSIVPVDLNALMFKMEKLLARASQEDGDNASASKYDALASARQKAMESHLWNDKEGWYADYDLKTGKVRNQLTAAALFPLYVKAASQDRADKVAAAASSRLLKPGGISTTTINSGQQWDAPNGWAPLQWVAVEGLQNYGQQKVAMDVTWRFLKNVQHTYDREKKLVEKYDVSSTGTGGGGGEYPLQDGFGWSNGVTLRMLDMVCLKEKPCDSVPENQPAANDDVAPAKQAAQ